MQASVSSPEAGGGYTARRGHGSQLSISDPNHHVTEAIGHMYDDDYDKRDSRRLSYISSPLSEAISIVPQTRASESPSQSTRIQGDSNGGHQRLSNGQSHLSMVRTKPSDDNPTSPGSTDTANTSFPLNDIDYESDPQAVAQELSNLAAIRRMSMDVTATGDPDLPSFNFPVPSIAPSPSDDENDTSRLFWVPARLHPELAPKEFKSFLESKSEHIKRRSGDFSSLSPDRQNSNTSLTRKRSMLSKQIDNGQGYTDGAERLERKRSRNRDPQGPNLHEIEDLVGESAQRSPSTSSLLESVQSLNISTEDDRPILPPAPPGHSLRRSTRTQYRKAGSLKKGERPSFPKRSGRGSETKDTLESVIGSPGHEPILGLTRVSTDPTPSVTRAQALAKSQGSAQASTTSAGASFDPTPEDSQQVKEGSHGQPLADSGNRVNAPQQPRQWNTRVSSNGRASPVIQDHKIPEIVETPPSEAHATPSQSSQPSHIPARVSSHDPPPQPKTDNKRPPLTSRVHPKESAPTLNDFTNNPQMFPGNSTRTDHLSFIPTLSEDRKSESKKNKDKKDSDGGRKSSWHWFLGSEDKDKDKEKKKDSESKKIKTKLVDKVHDAANVLPASSESSQRRESAIFDRHDTKLEEERKKDNARRSSAETRKEKESGLFSSIFGGSRKKNSEHRHKKSLSRTLSPEPPVRQLHPDVDYPWTRFSILEERAIYRMAHIKLANPRRALYSQVLLSNFMYSYLAKVQQMHPHMMLASSSSQRQQKSREQSEEYLQYQRYQEPQDQQYGDSSYDDPQMYDYGDDSHNYQQTSRGSKHQGYDNGNAYGPGHYQYGQIGDDVQLDDDDDDMW